MDCVASFNSTRTIASKPTIRRKHAVRVSVLEIRVREATHIRSPRQLDDFGARDLRRLGDVASQLVALRDEYEQAFARAIQDLPLPPRTDRRALRLMLLGALNWSQTWYRSGRDSPQVLARRFVRLLRDPLEP